MKRLVLLAVAICLELALGLPAHAAEPPRAADLEAELVCPVCETTLDQSNAPVAQRMKLFIRQRIAAGDSDAEIKDALVDMFGKGVIATPSKSGFGLLAWAIPLAALVAGGALLAVLLRRWSVRSREPDDEQPLDPALERRVDEELARFEG